MTRGLVFPASGLIVIAGLAGLAGCTASSGDEGILILKNVHAEAGCVSKAMESELSVSRGSLDLLLPSGYLFIAQMKSRITAAVGQEDQRTIIINGAKIDIAFPGSQLFGEAELAELKTAGLTHFKQLFTAPLNPNGGLTDVGFELIPRTLVEKIAARADLTTTFRLEAVATFTIEGDLAGDTVTSQPFTYPVTIGNNLSVNVAGACPLPKDFGAARTGYSCNAAQDGIIDCCALATGLKCPATVSTQ
jgi:hypothetical protein